MATETISMCSLCGLNITSKPFVDDEHLFCCAGCHAVFTVLSARAELEHGFDHPLFREAASAGLISNPKLLEQLKLKQQKTQNDEVEKEKLYLAVQGLWCPSCTLLIQYILLQKKGVLQCVVDYSTDIAFIEYQPRYISKEELYNQIRQLGYEIDKLVDLQSHQQNRSLTIRSVITAFFALNVMMFAYPLYATYFDISGESYGLLFAWLSCAASIPVMTYGAWPIYKRFFGALRTGYFGMETLVVIGAGSATLLSMVRLIQGNTHVYFDTAVVIVALVLGGKVIESRAKFNAKKTLTRLAKSQPKRGRKVLENGSAIFVPIDQIVPGDLVKTFSGEKIILDGEVIEGEASCDESLLTGESLPSYKTKGSKLIGGSFLLHGNLVWRVSSTLEDSVQQRILQLVKQDLGTKVVQENRIDIALRYFIPIILSMALITFLYTGVFGDNWDSAFERCLSVLLIACPCALGIAIPLVESQLIQKLAGMGALVRNRGCLQKLGKEDIFFFDKTGTVTKGYMQVISGLDGLSTQQKQSLSNISKQSTHPVSQAIARALNDEEEQPVAVVEYAGRGMEGTMNGNTYRYGSSVFFRSFGYTLPKENTDLQGYSICWVAENDIVIASITLGDTIRDDVHETISGLKDKETVLLSGDNKNAVETIANTLGFKQWQAEQSPLQKRERILQEKQKGKCVAMIGDGINDAPAMTASDIAISVLSATDISIQVSDILLTTEKLSVIIPIRKLAVKARKLVRQNLFWAFAYNIIGLGLAFFGFLSPIYSAFAMVASSIIVVCNAQRLRPF